MIGDAFVLIGDVIKNELPSTFVTGVAVGVPLIAAKLAWDTYKRFVGGDYEVPTSMAGYQQYCDDNDIGYHVDDGLEFANEEELEAYQEYLDAGGDPDIIDLEDMEDVDDFELHGQLIDKIGFSAYEDMSEDERQAAIENL